MATALRRSASSSMSRILGARGATGCNSTVGLVTVDPKERRSRTSSSMLWQTLAVLGDCALDYPVEAARQVRPFQRRGRLVEDLVQHCCRALAPE